ncbi:MAG TPA: hypothetical protein VM118_02025 [Acidobacteriota bacterium]|nr:hypothetical protein [Acidobacteriota bacterium]
MTEQSALKLLDAYTLRARFTPALLIVAPLWLAIAAWVAPALGDPSLPVSGVIGFAAVVLLAELGRDRGKASEATLFECWGGMPSVLLMSHSRSALSGDAIARRHSKLRALFPNFSLPNSAEDERGNWPAADSIYRSISEALRELTRDKARFPLVFEENTSYGFRRNLWAMRSLGVATSGFALVTSLANILLAVHRDTPLQPISILSAAICAALLVFWLWQVSVEWVRVVAFAYAERLFAAVEVL